MSYDEHLISMAGGDGDNVDQLAAIEARAQAATEGPWETHDGDVVQSYDIAVKTGEYSYEREGIIPGEWVRENDAEFIANARTDVPALLALVREQQAKLDRVEALHQPVPVYEIDPVNGTWVYGLDDERVKAFTLCGECSPESVMDDVEDGDCDTSGTYDDVHWPCPTIAAITATEEGK